MFGVLPPLSVDRETYLCYFQSCRVLFETVLSAGHINPGKTAFDHRALNTYIRTRQKQVDAIYNKLIDVALPEDRQLGNLLQRSSGSSLLLEDPTLDIFAE